MKLYLSSYRIPTPTELENLLGRPLAEAAVALIPNAKDYYANRARTVKINDTVRDLGSLGISNIKTVDLREIKDSSAPQDLLIDFDAVFVAGGNTFCLMHEVQRSGVDAVLRSAIENGLVYIGESAGAVIAGSTLKGTELADNPEFAERVLWNGLSLTSKAILPHADNASYAASTAEAAEMLGSDYDTVLLNDNQVYVVDGAAERIATGN